MLVFVLILAFVAGTKAEGNSAFHGPPPVKEVFNYNDRSFFLYSERVSWDEAKAICQSNDGNLAVPDDSNKASFLAQAISEAWAPFEDMWIGAQKVSHGWEWVVGDGKHLPDSTRQEANYTFMYPPWVDNRMPDRHERDCLAIDRNGHADPFFVDLECKLPRPFICELDESRNAFEPSVGKVVQIFDYEYILYHGRLSWDGAVAFCRENGYTLASVKNSTVAATLASSMLKTRPEFEDLWIGGQFKTENWVWVSDSEEISEIPTRADDDSPLFPPWAHVPPKRGKNCVLFDRHLCDEPKFLDVKCNRVRDFACMRPLDDGNKEEVFDTNFTKRMKTYVLHPTPVTWDEAKVVCEDDKMGKMLFLDGGVTQDMMEETMYIMQLMADNKIEMAHTWLGGRLDTDSMSFKWLGPLDNETPLVIDDVPSAEGFPPWCDGEKDVEMECLNLDRQNHLTPLMYGLECNVTQGVICVIDAKPKGRDIILADSRRFQTSEFSETEVESSWQKALYTCYRDTGMPLDRADDSTISEIVAFKDREQALSDGLYYIGAKYKSADEPKPFWNASNTEVELANLPPFNEAKPCLALEVKASALAGIVAVECNTPGGHNFICQNPCNADINEYTDFSWKCDWEQGSGVTERTINKMCHKKCKTGESLLGSRRVKCTKMGWTGNHGTLVLPACKASAQGLEFLKSEVASSDGLVFILDQSDRISEDDMKIFKYLIGTTITNLKKPNGGDKPAIRYRRSFGRRFKRDSDDKETLVPIISLTDGDVVTVTASGTDHCSLIDKININMTTGGRRNFHNAFYAARKLIDDSDSDLMSVIFISAGSNQGDDYRNVLKELKKTAKSVISIGVNMYIDEQLSEIASVSTDTKNLLMVGFTSTAYLKEAVDNLAAPGECETQIVPLKTDAAAAAAAVMDHLKGGGGNRPSEVESAAANGAGASIVNAPAAVATTPSGENAPPAVAPPAEGPPAVAPPVEAPPVEAPPAEAPPAEAPPAEAPPAEAPPGEAPPAEAPSAEAPPAEAPPAEAPPAEAPPAEQ